ncbi:Biphenyl dioxygenase subunit beta [Frankia canadensis]|uniref:Biphenyl dioxygenase subunit beta n=1 Tax=Frankia canadensis TaxID=1836972 RepID=A0A2I2KJL2_9ACTN|nr:3-phenylpropionate/cinnamic acid dioxygenase subunit beta [Frankia canadensis]SNQ45861.1 Biphenyl dioxygenase subunit beta [Frankia canadensis]SOU53151.1 Biphenyl dioxygenase subunit beta [Frankia canadensis]
MTTQVEAELTAFTAATQELQFRIEQFYYYEAELLDEWKYHAWYDLFSTDSHYRLPVRRNRLRRQRFADEAAARGIEMAHFDADMKTLKLYVNQRESGSNWAEDPPSRTRHLITNVRIRSSADEAGSYDVRSNFLVYRNRLEAEVDLWAGERYDRLRPTDDGSFQIADRVVLLDQNVVLSKNLSVFF